MNLNALITSLQFPLDHRLPGSLNGTLPLRPADRKALHDIANLMESLLLRDDLTRSQHLPIYKIIKQLRKIPYIKGDANATFQATKILPGTGFHVSLRIVLRPRSLRISTVYLQDHPRFKVKMVVDAPPDQPYGPDGTLLMSQRLPLYQEYLCDDEGLGRWVESLKEILNGPHRIFAQGFPPQEVVNGFLDGGMAS